MPSCTNTSNSLFDFRVSSINVYLLIENGRTFSAFTMDVIARCAFGLKIESLGDKDDPFIQNGQFIFNPPSNKTPLILLPCKSI